MPGTEIAYAATRGREGLFAAASERERTGSLFRANREILSAKREILDARRETLNMERKVVGAKREILSVDREIANAKRELLTLELDSRRAKEALCLAVSHLQRRRSVHARAKIPEEVVERVRGLVLAALRSYGIATGLAGTEYKRRYRKDKSLQVCLLSYAWAGTVRCSSRSPRPAVVHLGSVPSTVVQYSPAVRGWLYCLRKQSHTAYDTVCTRVLYAIGLGVRYAMSATDIAYGAAGHRTQTRNS
eukprot:1718772-Rhodomonas_salina.1